MGAAHARMLVAEGAKVVISDILDDDGKALADELGAAAARYVHLDVTDADQWDAAVATAVGEFGKLNVLVNNAGIVALGQIGKFDMTKWQKVIDVNLTGTFLGMQASVEAMKTAGGGSIINVSSIEGPARRAPMVHPYVATKWAVRGPVEVGGAGLGQVQHPGQLVAPGLHPHADDQALPRRPWSPARSAGPVSPTRWPHSWCSSPVTSRRSPPAPSSSWTAV